MLSRAVVFVSLLSAASAALAAPPPSSTCTFGRGDGNLEPVVSASPDGSYRTLAWIHGQPGGPSFPGTFRVRVQRLDGLTGCDAAPYWEPPLAAGMNVSMEPHLARSSAAGGALYLTYVSAQSTVGVNVRSAVHLFRSTDDGLTWSSPCASGSCTAYASFTYDLKEYFERSSVSVRADGSLALAYVKISTTAQPVKYNVVVRSFPIGPNGLLGSPAVRETQKDTFPVDHARVAALGTSAGGQWAVVYDQAAIGKISMARYNDGSLTTSPVAQDRPLIDEETVIGGAKAGTQPDIAYNRPMNRLDVAWHESIPPCPSGICGKTGVFYTSASLSAATPVFSPPVPLHTPQNDLSVAMKPAVASDGNVCGRAGVAYLAVEQEHESAPHRLRTRLVVVDEATGAGPQSVETVSDGTYDSARFGEYTGLTYARGWISATPAIEGVETVTGTMTVLRRGDLDLDGVIDVNDVIILQNHVVGNVDAGEPPFLATVREADVNVDGAVDVNDVIALQFAIVNGTCALPL